MTVSFAFSLVLPSVASGSTPAELAAAAAASGDALMCNAVSYDAAHFLSMLDRLLPEEYLSPLKLNPGTGYELFQALAKVGERVSVAIERLECGSYILFASGAVRTLVSVVFARVPDAPGALTIRTGTIVGTSRHGRKYRLVDDVVFDVADLELPGIVEAIDAGFEYNVPGQVTAGSVVLEGEIDTIFTQYTEPAHTLDEVSVYQVLEPTTPGKTPDLDGLGDNRGIYRNLGETDATYRLRIRSMPDVVSPGAIRRAVERVLASSPVPLDFVFIETFELRYQTCWDAPSPNVGTPTYDGGTPPLADEYDDTVFVFDDPRPVTLPTQFKNRWLDSVEYRGAFIVVLPNNVTVEDVGLAYDDLGTGPTDFLASNGRRRGTPAYDIDNDDNVTVMTAAYDGFDRGRGALYAAIYADIQRIKAAGVAGIIETTRE